MSSSPHGGQGTGSEPSSGQHTHLNRASVLLALCLAGFDVTLTYTGIAVAVPTIQNDLQGSRIAGNWIIDAFVLAKCHRH
jgi:hypothetical protein